VTRGAAAQWLGHDEVDDNPSMSSPIDFEAEGLLDGLAGEERDSRLALLEKLADDGAEIEELRSAVAEGRLALMPLERMLAGRPRYTSSEISELAGVPIDELERQWRSLGLAVPNRDEKVLSREDLESANRMRAILDTGLSSDRLAELGRTIAVAMSQFAAASRQVVATTIADEGGSEDEVSNRLSEAGTGLIPTVGPTLDYVYRRHLREQLRHAMFDVEGEGGVGAVTDAGPIAIGFADLVGFTRLGEQLPPEQLGRVTGRLEEAAGAVVHGPVRLVKLIGDAAMFASSDSTSLLEAILELVETVDSDEEDGYPLLRAGVSYGQAFTRGGDYYGPPVNLASRITEVARPGSVLIDGAAKDHVSEGSYRFSRAGRKSLKGISGSVELYRVRRLETPDHDP
jgi:adenylate cyclase